MVCFVGSWWQGGPMWGGGRERGQHLWQKVRKISACPSLLPARLLLRCGLTRRPFTTLGAHESLHLSRLLAGRPRPPRGLWRPPQLRHQRRVVSGRHLKPRAFCWAETGEMALLSWHEVHVPSSQGLCGRGLCGAGVGVLAWPAVSGPHALLSVALFPKIPAL